MQEEIILQRIAQSSLASLPENRICEQPVPRHANSHNCRSIPAWELIVKSGQKARIPVDRSIGIMSADHTPQIVVEQAFGHASQVGERMQMTANEPDLLHGDRKVEVHRS